MLPVRPRERVTAGVSVAAAPGKAWTVVSGEAGLLAAGEAWTVASGEPETFAVPAGRKTGDEADVSFAWRQ